MGYKHSPANAKLSAFMQKMNNTAKSPARQFDSKTQAKESLTSQSKEKTTEKFNPADYRTIKYLSNTGDPYTIKVKKDNPVSDAKALANHYNVLAMEYKAGIDDDGRLARVGNLLRNNFKLSSDWDSQKGQARALDQFQGDKVVRHVSSDNWTFGEDFLGPHQGKLSPKATVNK